MEIRAGDRVYELISSTEAKGVMGWARKEDYEYLRDHLDEFRFFGVSAYDVVFLGAQK